MGFGISDAAIIATVMNLVLVPDGADVNHIASITAMTRKAYIMKRMGSALDIRGSLAKNAHGMVRLCLPAMWSAGPIAAMTITVSNIINILPSGVGQ